MERESSLPPFYKGSSRVAML